MNLTEKQTADFNRYFKEACSKTKGIIILEDYRPKGIGFFEKFKARKAISLFKKALEIYPESFESLFFIGKIYQRLGEYEKSLSYFETAMKYESKNHNLPQEASLVAMHLNQIEKAIEYSKEALRRSPDNFAIMGNHSMNLLIAGQDDEAIQMITKAMLLNPDDTINQNIKAKIEAVRSGKIKRPTFKSSIG